MKYTSYFADKFKRHGVPTLSYEQFARLMNIVFLEGTLQNFKSFEREHTLGRYRIEWRLTKLTKDKEPYYLLQEMIKLSKENK